MSSKTVFINAEQIKTLRQTFQDYSDAARSEHERSIWQEGVACLKNAQPSYLISLIPDDYPDRRELLELIEEYDLIPRRRGQPQKSGDLIRVPCRFVSQSDYDLVIDKLSITERAQVLVKAAKSKR